MAVVRAVTFVLLIVFTPIIVVSTTCSDYNITTRCNCTENENGDLAKIICSKVNLTEMPQFQMHAPDIRIENNSIDVIEHLLYNDVVHFLSLQWNHIGFIKDGAFSNLRCLRILNLGFNEIGSLRFETFIGLISLTKLILRGNPIYTIKSGTFSATNLPTLEELNLENTSLYEFEDNGIDGIESLTYIYMSHNKLQTTPKLGCHENNMHFMAAFDLSFNEISRLIDFDCYMPDLQHFELNNNKIERLEANFLPRMLYDVRSLHLQYNNISSIHTDAFINTRNLTMLDISHNNLTDIDGNALPWQTLISVIVMDNPWNCVCNNRWLEDGAVTLNNKKDSVRCRTPSVYHNMTLDSVEDEVFSHCDVNSSHTVVMTVIGVLLGVVALTVFCTVMYFTIIRRRSHDNISGPTSSIYRRMDTGDEVIFDAAVKSSTRRPMWKEMTTYDERNNNPFT